MTQDRKLLIPVKKGNPIENSRKMEVCDNWQSGALEKHWSVKRLGGSSPSTSAMSTFEYKNGQIVCKKCGSKNVSIKAGMMVDRAWCNDCNNEDYI